ncbi:MAG: BON domain-containing protein [Pirellula sp.]
MKYTFTNFALGAALALISSGADALGQFQTGSTGGFGGAPQQGFGGTQGFGGQTGVAGVGGAGGIGGATTGATGGTFSPANGPFGGAGVSGAFGGRGVSGVIRPGQEFSTLNAANGVVVPQTNALGTGGTGGQQQQSQFGGTNTQFGAGGQGGIGGLGGLGGITAFGRTGGLGGIGGLGGLGGGQAGRANANQAKSKIRTIVKPDIDITRDTSAVAAANVQARMGRIPLPPRIANVNYSVEAGTVVIRGEVSSESDKKLAERLVLLEPGVNSVKNEVLVRNKTPEKIPAVPIR